MEVKKAVKKIIALGTGLTMLGTTILGAMALDLGSYPQPFVKNGMFDGLIVIGEKAQGMDVVGAVDIGSSMQYAVKQETSGATTSTSATATVAQGTQIEQSGRIMMLGDDINTIKSTSFDETDLPTVLAKGTYTDTKGETSNEDISYDQSLKFLAGNAQIVYDAEDQSGNDITADYLKLSSNLLYTYRLEFGTDVQYKNDTTTCTSGATNAKNDFEATTLEIQGNTYTVTGADCKGAGNAVNDITFMAGETTTWLTQDQVVTKTIAGKEHTVQVSDVTDAQDSCGVLVDGTLVWIDTGASQTINGVRIGVLDAKAVHSQLQDQDICELNIGSKKVEFNSGSRIKVDGTEVDDAEASIEAVGNKLTALEVNYTPSETVWLKAGDSWVDPALGNWKLTYGGLSQTTEDISISTSASTGKIKFMTGDDQTIELPMSRDTAKSDLRFGEDYAKRKLVVQGAKNQDCEDTTNTKNDCKNTLLFVVTAGHVPHLMKITDIFKDTDNQNKTTIRDVVSGNEYTNAFTWNSTPGDVKLGSLGTVKINLTDDGLISAQTLNLAGEPARTKYGMDIILPYFNGAGYTTPDFGAVNGGFAAEAGKNITVRFQEEAWTDSHLAAVRANFNVSFYIDELASGKDTKVIVGGQNDASNWTAANPKQLSDAQDTQEVYVSKAGTKIVEDTNNNNKVTITYPDTGASANVYIAPVMAEVTTVTTSGVPVYLQQINVGSAKLDSEISSVSAQNLIVVGGPCANSVAAQLMGVTYQGADCAKDFTAGKAMIKLFDTGSGKVALLVAGMTADDTRAATRVLAQPSKYTLSGTEVEVTYTDLADITVSAPKTQ